MTQAPANPVASAKASSAAEGEPRIGEHATAATDGAGGDAATAGSNRWSGLWQLPALVLGVGLFGAGLYFSLPRGDSDSLPNFPGTLDQAAHDLQAGKLKEARRTLEEVSRHLNEPRATKLVQARYARYRAALAYQMLHNKDAAPMQTAARRQVNRRIAASYAKAARLGPSMDPRSLRRWALTLAALGREKKALTLVDRLGDDSAADRAAIVRALIERRQAHRPHGDPAAMTPLLERFKEEVRREHNPARRREGKIQAATLRAKQQLAAHDPQRTIDFLLHRIQRLTSTGGDDDLAPLMVLLARAYQKTADFPNANRLYRYAQQKLPEADPLNARVLLGLGRIVLATSDDVRGALDLFTAAAKQYPLSPIHVQTLIARADAEARIGSTPAAIKHFGEAAEQLARTPVRDPRREQFAQVVQDHVAHAMDAKRFDRALDYLTLLTPLYTSQAWPTSAGEAAARADDSGASSSAALAPIVANADALPSALLGRFAMIHEGIADQRRTHARRLTQRLAQHPEKMNSLKAARRLANQQAALHDEQAGEYFLLHAKAVATRDDDAYGTSLWKAADAFDQAQDWKRAIRVFSRFRQSQPDDPRQIAAMHRLGKAYLADGQDKAAARLLGQLVHLHPNSPEAFDSLVPLARAQLALNHPDAAKRILLRVVTDHPAITPDSTPYKHALIELGKLYYQLGPKQPAAWPKAIARLTEAVQRYGKGNDGPRLRYLLADAYRRSVRALDQRLGRQTSAGDDSPARRDGVIMAADFASKTGSTPASEFTPPNPRTRAALKAERDRRLQKAQGLYQRAITGLEARPQAALSKLERLYRRNAYFYQADCAFDRGRFQQAIDLYDRATRRWKDNPASLVAMMQIVNARCELGQYKKARAANKRAQWRLKHLPDQAFDDPTLPMTRKQWEDWLRWTNEKRLFTAPTPDTSSTPRAASR